MATNAVTTFDATILISADSMTVLTYQCVFFNQIKGELKTAIKEKMNQQYGVNEDVTKSIDKLQQEVSSNNLESAATSLKCKALWNAEYIQQLNT